MEFHKTVRHLKNTVVKLLDQGYGKWKYLKICECNILRKC